MNGLELIRKLKAASIVFEAIILSGYSDFEYARKGIDLGVHKYLLKPVQQEELLMTVEQAIACLEGLTAHDDETKTGQESIRREISDDPYGDGSTIEQIRKYIDTHFTQNISLSGLADRFFLNPYYLSQLFKKKTGETYIQYLTKKRMEKARELLKKDMKICDVCHSVGYENVKHFSRTFERIVGVKPSEYKS